jgi:HlyD family secretion protein
MIMLALPFAACEKSRTENIPLSSAPPRGAVSQNPQSAIVTPSVPRVSPVQTRTYPAEVRAKNQVAIVSRISGRIENLKVRVGDKVRAGDVIAVIEHQAVDASVKQAGAALAIAEANLKKAEEGRQYQIMIAEATFSTAKAKLEGLLAGATSEQIAIAEATLASAQAKLNQLLAGPTREQIKMAENDVELARRQRIYQEAVADVSVNPTVQRSGAFSYEMRSAILDVYDQQVQIAMDKLAGLKAPPTAEAIAQLKAAVDIAQAQLDMLRARPKPSDVAQLESAVASAKAQLDLVKPPFANYDLEIARAAVAQARANLQTAQAQQAEAFLRSPIDGTIASRDLTEGALASSGSTVATVVSQDLEIVFAVEEKNIGQMSSGMRVSVSTSSSQRPNFQGQVAAIAPAANRSTRTFDVYVDIDVNSLSASSLRPGMFVTVSIPESGAK